MYTNKKTTWVLLLSSAVFGGNSYAQAPTAAHDAQIARMTEMIIEMAPAGMELGEQYSANSVRLNEFVPGQTPAKLDCLRREFKRDAYRKRKLMQVRAYAEAHPDRFAEDYSLLDGSLFNYLQEFAKSKGDLPDASEKEQHALTALFEGSQYQSLHTFIGMTRLQRTIIGAANRTTRDQELTYRSMAVETAPALQACEVAYPQFVQEVLAFTAAYADPTLLTQDFGRECHAPMAVPEPELSKRTVTPARPDPKKPFKAPVYPSMARRAEIEGTAMIEVLVNEHGETTGARVKNTSGSVMLDSSALQASRDWRFIPANKDGAPVCMNVIFPLVFKLNE